MKEKRHIDEYRFTKEKDKWFFENDFGKTESKLPHYLYRQLRFEESGVELKVVAPKGAFDDWEFFSLEKFGDALEWAQLFPLRQNYGNSDPMSDIPIFTNEHCDCHADSVEMARLILGENAILYDSRRWKTQHMSII